MTSDHHDLIAGPTPDGDGELGRLPDAIARTGGNPNAQLTHAQRVERCNAYLKASASRGIWTAIE